MQVHTESNSGLEYLTNSFHSNKAVILFHGYGASMRDLYGLSEAIPLVSPVDWIFPDGPISVPLGMFMEGRAWFPIDMAELERAMMAGEFRDFEDKCPQEFLDSLVKAKTFIQSMLTKYDEVIIGGFSQGAMITTHMLAQDLGDKVKGAILYSSTLIAKEKLINELEGKKTIPFLQSHGKKDQVLDYNAAMKLFELLKLNRFEGEFISFTGAHEIPMDVIHKSKAFIEKYL